jgi:flagellar protein FliL
MAEENEENVEKSGGGKKKLILMVVGALLLVGGSIGGTLFLVGGDKAEETAEVVEEEVKKAHYFSLDPPFVVNFQGNGKGRFLQITLDAMTYDEAVLDVVRTHMPALRNNLILLFSNQVSETLATPEGKDLLRAATLTAVQQVIEKETGEKGVDEVYFTNFVMQ